jgi:hypothetical protein
VPAADEPVVVELVAAERVAFLPAASVLAAFVPQRLLLVRVRLVQVGVRLDLVGAVPGASSLSLL